MSVTERLSGSVKVTYQQVQAIVTALKISEDADVEAATSAVLEAMQSRELERRLEKVRDDDMFATPDLSDDERKRWQYCNSFINMRRAKEIQRHEHGLHEETARNVGMPVNDEMAIGEDTVAYVQVDGSTDPEATYSMCARVLEAGGRVLLPKPDEMKNRYSQAAFDALAKMLAEGGYGREIRDDAGVVFVKSSQGGVSDETRKLIAEAGGNSVFMERTYSGKTKRGDGIRKSTGSVFDAIVNGEVTCIPKTFSDGGFDYSQWEEGQVVQIKRRHDGVVDSAFVRVRKVERLTQADVRNRQVEVERRTGIKDLDASSGDVALIEFELVGKDMQRKPQEALTTKRKGRAKGKGRYWYYRYRRSGNGWRRRKEYTQNRELAESMRVLAKAIAEHVKALGAAVSEDLEEELQAKGDKAEEEALERLEANGIKRDEYERYMRGEKVPLQIERRINEAQRELGLVSDQSMFQFDSFEAESREAESLNMVFSNVGDIRDCVESMVGAVLRDIEEGGFESELKSFRERLLIKEKEAEEKVRDAKRGRELRLAKRSLRDVRRKLVELGRVEAQFAEQGWVAAFGYNGYGMRVLKEMLEYFESYGFIASKCIGRARDKAYDNELQSYIDSRVKSGIEDWTKVGNDVSRMTEGEKALMWFLAARTDQYEDVRTQYNLTKTSLGDEFAQIGYGDLWEIEQNACNIIIYMCKNGWWERLRNNEGAKRALMSRVLQALSRRCDTTIRLVEEESDETDERPDDAESMRSEYEEDEQDEIESRKDDTGKDWYEVRVTEDNPYKTVSKRVKLALNTVADYRYDSEYDYWNFPEDGHFGIAKYVNVGTVWSTLLRDMHDVRDSDEMVARLKSMEKEVGWYHSLVEKVKSSEGLKSALFSTLRKGFHRMRVARTTTKDEGSGWRHPSMALWGSNYGENKSALLDEVQQNMTLGIVLDKKYSTYDTNGLPDWNRIDKLKAEVLSKIDHNLQPEQVVDYFANDENVSRMAIVLRALGVDIRGMEGLERLRMALTRYPEGHNDLMLVLDGCVWAVTGEQRKKYASKYAQSLNMLVDMCDRLASLTDENSEHMSYENHKGRYSYSDPNYITDMADACQDANRFSEWMEDRFLKRDRDGALVETFFYDPTEGGDLRGDAYSQGMSIRSGWLRDMAKWSMMRRIVSSETAQVIVKDGKDSDKLDRQSVLRIQLNMFFSPSGKRHLPLNDRNFVANRKTLPVDLANYVFPTLADSKAIVTMPGRAFTPRKKIGDGKYDRFKDESNESAFTDALATLDFEEDGLLWRMAEVVLQEYRRIRCSENEQSTNTKLDDKGYEKNKGKFCYFAELNNVDGFREELGRLLTSGEQEAAMTYAMKVLKYKVMPRKTIKAYRELVAAGALNDDSIFDADLAEGSENVGSIHSISEDKQWFDEQLNMLMANNGVGKVVDGVKRPDDVRNPMFKLWSALTEEELDYIRRGGDYLTYGLEEIEHRYDDIDINASPEEIEAKVLEKALRERERRKAIEESIKDKWKRISPEMTMQNSTAGLALWRIFNASSKGMFYTGTESTYNTGQTTSHHNPTCYVGDGLGETECHEQNPGFYAMSIFLLNQMYAQTQMEMMTIGDVANVKNVPEYTKRNKMYFATRQRVDLAATYNGFRIFDPSEGEDWDKERCLYLSDFSARKENEHGESRTTGFWGMSQFWNDVVLPELSTALAKKEITPNEFASMYDAYSSMTISDGQSFRSPESWRKIMIGTSNWNAEHEDWFNRVLDGTCGVADFARHIQTLKPYCESFEWVNKPYMAVETETVNGVETKRTVKKDYWVKVPVQHKNSEFILFGLAKMMEKHSGSKNSVLAGIEKAMRRHNIDVVHFSSVVKVGGHDAIDITQCRNSDEVVSTVDDVLGLWEAAKNAGERSTDGVHRIPWRDYGVQVSTQKDHMIDAEQGIGVQIRKLIAADIPDTFNGNPVKIDVNMPDGSVLSLTPKEYRRKCEEIIIAKLRRSFEDVKMKFDDEDWIRGMIQKSIVDSDRYSRNMVDMMTQNEDGEFRIPLDHEPLATNIQTILAAYLKRHIVKQTTRGGTAIQCSSVGLSNDLHPVTETVNGRTRVLYYPCMLPCWAKEIYRAYADENGDIDVDKIPDKLRNMIGYRVPTEHMYSMAPLRVVGFMNQENGTAILLPQEIVTFSGSDFDVDKMFLMMPDFDTNDITIDDEALSSGMLEYKDGVAVPTGALYNKALRSTMPNDEYDHYLKEMVKAGAEMEWDVMTDEQKEEFKSREDTKEYIEEYMIDHVDEDRPSLSYRTPDYHQPFDTQVRNCNNALIELYWARLTSTWSFSQLTKPGGFVEVKRLSRIMNILRSKSMKDIRAIHSSTTNTEELWNELVTDNIDFLDEYTSGNEDSFSDPMLFSRYFEQNMTGKHMVGVYALANSLQSLLQNAKVEISADYMNAFGRWSFNGKTLYQLWGMYDEIGQSRILNIAQFLAASVDNAKDPVLAELNQNNLTCNLGILLLRMGYSIETMVLFLNQPVIKKAVDTFNSGETQYVSLQKILEQLYGDVKPAPNMNLTKKDMIEAIVNNKPNVNGEVELDDIQLRVINTVKALYQATLTVGRLGDTLKMDSPKNSLGVTLGDTYEAQTGFLRFRHKNTLTLVVNGKFVKINVLANVENFGNDVFATKDNTLPTVEQWLKKFFDEEHPGVASCQAWYDMGLKLSQEFIAKVLSGYGGEVKDLMKQLNLMTRDPSAYELDGGLMNELRMDYVAARTARAFMQDNGKTLMEQRSAYLRSFPTYYQQLIKQLLDEGRDITKEYELLSMLTINEESGDVFFRKQGKIKKELSEALSASWERMMYDDDQRVQQLALNLCTYSAYRDGFQFRHVTEGKTVNKVVGGCYGYMVPAAVLERFPNYIKALRDLHVPMTESEQKEFLDQFIRNHPEYFDMFGQTLDMMDPDAPQDKSPLGRLKAMVAGNGIDRKTFFKIFDRNSKREVEKNSAVVGTYNHYDAFDEIRLGKFTKGLVKNVYQTGSNTKSATPWMYLKVMLDEHAPVFYRLIKVEDNEFVYRRVEMLTGNDYDLQSESFGGYDTRFSDIQLFGRKLSDIEKDEASGGTGDDAMAIRRKASVEIVSEIESNQQKVQSYETIDINGVSHNDTSAYVIEENGIKKTYERVHDHLGLKLDESKLDPKAVRRIRFGGMVGSIMDSAIRHRLRTGSWEGTEDMFKGDDAFVTRMDVAKSVMGQIDDFINGIEAEGGKVMDGPVVWHDFGNRGKVAGAIDILVLNADGSFSIYDIKCMSNYDRLINGRILNAGGKTINYGDTLNNYKRQLNAYRILLKEQYGVEVSGTYIFPIEYDGDLSTNEIDRLELMESIVVETISLDNMPERGEQAGGGTPTPAPTGGQTEVGVKGRDLFKEKVRKLKGDEAEDVYVSNDAEYVDALVGRINEFFNKAFSASKPANFSKDSYEYKGDGGGWNVGVLLNKVRHYSSIAGVPNINGEVKIKWKDGYGYADAKAFLDDEGYPIC